MKRAFLSRTKRLLRGSRHSRNQGFTLLELLVVTAIGAGLISGLMFIVVQLMETDQREASRSETQREMQMALDYISSELREAVYVYTGTQLKTLVDNNYLASSVTSGGGVPVLAFWRQYEFPEVAREFCRNNAGETTANINARRGINCEAGSSYALIVYSIKPKSGNWRGEAHLTRYALTEFESSWASANTPEINKGYVNPGAFKNFAVWPMDEAPAPTPAPSPAPPAPVNLQGIKLTDTYNGGRPEGRPEGAAFALVDFVALNTPTTPSCPTTNHVMSPSDAATAKRGFYVCLLPRITEGTAVALGSGENQEVLLFLQGNVSGRPGYTTALGARTADKLPTLETRVLTRAILNRIPPSE